MAFSDDLRGLIARLDEVEEVLREADRRVIPAVRVVQRPEGVEHRLDPREVAGLDVEAPRGEHVVELVGELVDRGRPLAPAHALVQADRVRGEVLGMSASRDRGKVGIALELVDGVLVDRLEHRESLSIPALCRPQQALVDERAEPVDDVDAGQRVDADAHLFDVVDLRRREHREDLEQRAFVLVEQLVTPGDRGAQGPLAVGQVARPTAEDIEPAPEAVAQLGG